MTEMTKRERVRAAISGEPVDRAPASLWGHDFLREWSNDELVGATCEQYEAYDWDFIKINPRWSMFPEAWGAVYQPPVEQTNQTMISPALSELDELHDVVSVHAERGVFGEHIESTRRVVERTKGEVDVVQTVFSPMATVGLMFGHPRAFKQAAAESSAAVHGAIARVTETIINYSRANMNAGASGVFYAPLQWASHATSTPDFYREFGRPYDLQVLDAIRDAEFNVLHVCFSEQHAGRRARLSGPRLQLGRPRRDQRQPGRRLVADRQGGHGRRQSGWSRGAQRGRSAQSGVGGGQHRQHEGVRHRRLFDSAAYIARESRGSGVRGSGELGEGLQRIRPAQSGKPCEVAVVGVDLGVMLNRDRRDVRIIDQVA